MKPANPEAPVRVALAGAGEFGMTLVTQAERVTEISLCAIADLDAGRAEDLFRRAGVPDDSVKTCGSASEAEQVLAGGGRVVVEDAAILPKLPLDVLVEATGDPESAAAVALQAIDAGIHVVMASKETDSVAGCALAERARGAGVVYTLVEGDQPSLLVGLIQRARRMGLQIVAAGKATEHDVIFDPASGAVSWRDHQTSSPGLKKVWRLEGGRGLHGNLARRHSLLSAFPAKTASDLCEICLVSNATGLLPDVPILRAPFLRSVELPDVLRPKPDGGILEHGGHLEVFTCLRRPDEASFAGGVFVVVAWPDGDSARVLGGKGHPTSRDGRLGLLYSPTHLLGVEAILSVLAAAREGRATGQPTRPRVDFVARAVRDFAAGETLIMGGHNHVIEGTEALLLPAGPLGQGAPVPYHLASNRNTRVAIPAGTVIRCGMIDLPEDSVLRTLRQEQDARFFAACRDPVE